MLLREYIKQKKLNARKFGELMGWETTKAWRVAYANWDITLSEALLIEEKTKGKVKPKDILEAYKLASRGGYAANR